MRRKKAMRKRYRVLILATIVAALIVPFGFALSLDSNVASDVSEGSLIAASTVAAPLSGDVASALLPSVPDVPDAAKLLLVGAGLFALASAVRRSA